MLDVTNLYQTLTRSVELKNKNRRAMKRLHLSYDEYEALERVVKEQGYHVPGTTDATIAIETLLLSHIDDSDKSEDKVS